jgi:hypothetical protein
MVYNAKGMYDESVAALRSNYALRGFTEAEEALALSHTEGDYREAMRRLGDTLVTLRSMRHIPPETIAWSYLMAGEDSLALDWLEWGFEERDSWMPYLSADPGYDPLRQHPRFQDLLRRMGLPQ